MNSLRQRDWRAGVELLQAAAAADSGVDALAESVLRALPALVASEVSSLSICDLASGRRRVIGTPAGAIGADDRACFDRHFREHPLVHYHADLRGAGAHRISDSVPFARFRHTALYSDYYRRIGIDHAVALPIQVDERRLVSFVLNRRGRDFSDRDRDALDMVAAPLARLYAQSEAIERAGLAGLRLNTSELTARERQVLHWLAAGKTDREIGVLLACSHRTVQKHLQRVYVKLGVESRTAAVMRATGLRWPACQ